MNALVVDVGDRKFIVQVKKVSELVRCRDCKHYPGAGRHGLMCQQTGFVIRSAEDFCSHGEKGPDPDVDFVSVVRCEDCKYWSELDVHSGECFWHSNGVTERNAFCSYGERG